MNDEHAALDAAALRAIVEGTAAETGSDFFDQLVKHMARAMGTKCAWVTEWFPDSRRLRALSFWVGDDYFGDFEYAIAGTPCEPVIEDRRLIHVRERLVELFATDASLEPLGAVSYMGVPLFDTDREILGHLAVMHDEPMDEDDRITGIFNIFAARAAAELQRLRRDRDLREREEKLRGLISNAMDAIVELDADLAVIDMNGAAERAFECKKKALQGDSFEQLLSRSARGKLSYLITDLARKPIGEQSAWFPDGIEIRDSKGGEFTAEGTISRWEHSGVPYFTLILRNVDEREEAERRIRDLMNETEYLRAEIESIAGFDDIVGESEKLRSLLLDVERVAKSDATVLIHGETGTGKELVARAIHRRSERAERPLIAVNCAAIASNLQESEFFGHERGAFTGATQRRDGRFKLADGGTIFLDEIGEMPLDLQAKLLRVLQEGEFEPVGSSRPVQVDVRVIAASNRDLNEMVEAGDFREDLLYRLNVFPLRVPPLRERQDDVILLAEAFARRLARRRGIECAPLSAAAKRKLRDYDWPGNVRELQNVIERALIVSRDGRTLDLERALPDAASPAGAGDVSPRASDDRILDAAAWKRLERDNLLRALERSGWKISGAEGAAELLGTNPNTLASRMKVLGIQRPPKN